MDVRLWSKELITDFINEYKSLPCLWKVKSEEYNNRNLRDKAYNRIIELCKSRGFPEANRDFVVKKLQSLRGSFRKELKKVVDHQRSGRGTDEIYKPSLWYYDLLQFTKDDELPTDSMSNMEDSVDSTIYFLVDSEKEMKQEFEENEENGWKEEPNENEEPVMSQPSTASTPQLLPPIKKRKNSNSQAEFFKFCTTTLKANNQSLTEYDAIGINVSKKLSKMETTQAIYAESLISGIIRRGLLTGLAPKNPNPKTHPKTHPKTQEQKPG